MWKKIYWIMLISVPCPYINFMLFIYMFVFLCIYIILGIQIPLIQYCYTITELIYHVREYIMVIKIIHTSSSRLLDYTDNPDFRMKPTVQLFFLPIQLKWDVKVSALLHPGGSSMCKQHSYN